MILFTKILDKKKYAEHLESFGICASELLDIILKAMFYTVVSAEIRLVQCNVLVKTFWRALPSVTRSRESNCP